MASRLGWVRAQPNKLFRRVVYSSCDQTRRYFILRSAKARLARDLMLYSLERVPSHYNPGVCVSYEIGSVPVPLLSPTCRPMSFVACCHHPIYLAKACASRLA